MANKLDNMILTYKDVFKRGSNGIFYCCICGFTLYSVHAPTECEFMNHGSGRPCSFVYNAGIKNKLTSREDMRGLFRIVDSSWEELTRVKTCNILSQYGENNVTSRFKHGTSALKMLRSYNYNEMLRASNNILVVVDDKRVKLDDVLAEQFNITIKKHYIRFCVVFAPENANISHIINTDKSRQIVSITCDDIKHFTIASKNIIEIQYRLVNSQPYCTDNTPPKLSMYSPKFDNNFYIYSQLEDNDVLNTTAYFFYPLINMSSYAFAKGLLYHCYNDDTKQKTDYTELIRDIVN